MNNLREIFSADEVNFEKQYDQKTGVGLVTVLCIDGLKMASKGFEAVRMVANANYEAVELTLQTGMTTLYSRSRSGLWVKGEESGNTLPTRAVYADCDADVLIYDVIASGPSCHTGAETCFVNPTIGE
jgi:phosphoribosyl-AMP cyclohydrolase